MKLSAYKVVEITSEMENIELICAMMSILDFDSFHEDENRLLCYFLPQNVLESELEDQLKKVSALFPIQYAIHSIEEENWNKKWEENFEPVVVDNKIRVRAPFHKASESNLIDILINPQMAFGTAHHETTYMMLSTMLDIDLSNKNILDYGCGTGILALLAEKRNAAQIKAIDYDIKSVNNTLENIQLNNAERIEVLEGDLLILNSTQTYDVILANINRKVLLQTASQLFSKLTHSGTLIMSGILEVDFELIKATYAPFFHLVNQRQKGEWLCLVFAPKR